MSQKNNNIFKYKSFIKTRISYYISEGVFKKEDIILKEFSYIVFTAMNWEFYQIAQIRKVLPYSGDLTVDIKRIIGLFLDGLQTSLISHENWMNIFDVYFLNYLDDYGQLSKEEFDIQKSPKIIQIQLPKITVSDSDEFKKILRGKMNYKRLRLRIRQNLRGYIGENKDTETREKLVTHISNIYYLLLLLVLNAVVEGKNDKDFSKLNVNKDDIIMVFPKLKDKKYEFYGLSGLTNQPESIKRYYGKHFDTFTTYLFGLFAFCIKRDVVVVGNDYPFYENLGITTKFFKLVLFYLGAINPTLTNIVITENTDVLQYEEQLKPQMTDFYNTKETSMDEIFRNWINNDEVYEKVRMNIMMFMRLFIDKLEFVPDFDEKTFIYSNIRTKFNKIWKGVSDDLLNKHSKDRIYNKPMGDKIPLIMKYLLWNGKKFEKTKRQEHWRWVRDQKINTDPTGENIRLISEPDYTPKKKILEEMKEGIIPFDNIQLISAIYPYFQRDYNFKKKPSRHFPKREQEYAHGIGYEKFSNLLKDRLPIDPSRVIKDKGHYRNILELITQLNEVENIIGILKQFYTMIDTKHWYFLENPQDNTFDILFDDLIIKNTNIFKVIVMINNLNYAPESKNSMLYKALLKFQIKQPDFQKLIRRNKSDPKSIKKQINEFCRECMVVLYDLARFREIPQLNVYSSYLIKQILLKWFIRNVFAIMGLWKYREGVDLVDLFPLDKGEQWIFENMQGYEVEQLGKRRVVEEFSPIGKKGKRFIFEKVQPYDDIKEDPFQPKFGTGSHHNKKKKRHNFYSPVSEKEKRFIFENITSNDIIEDIFKSAQQFDTSKKKKRRKKKKCQIKTDVILVKPNMKRNVEIGINQVKELDIPIEKKVEQFVYLFKDNLDNPDQLDEALRIVELIILNREKLIELDEKERDLDNAKSAIRGWKDSFYGERDKLEICKRRLEGLGVQQQPQQELFKELIDYVDKIFEDIFPDVEIPKENPFKDAKRKLDEIATISSIYEEFPIYKEFYEKSKTKCDKELRDIYNKLLEGQKKMYLKEYSYDSSKTLRQNINELLSSITKFINNTHYMLKQFIIDKLLPNKYWIDNIRPLIEDIREFKNLKGKSNETVWDFENHKFRNSPNPIPFKKKFIGFVILISNSFDHILKKIKRVENEQKKLKEYIKKFIEEKINHIFGTPYGNNIKTLVKNLKPFTDIWDFDTNRLKILPYKMIFVGFNNFIVFTVNALGKKIDDCGNNTRNISQGQQKEINSLRKQVQKLLNDRKTFELKQQRNRQTKIPVPKNTTTVRVAPDKTYEIPVSEKYTIESGENDDMDLVTAKDLYTGIEQFRSKYTVKFKPTEGIKLLQPPTPSLPIRRMQFLTPPITKDISPVQYSYTMNQQTPGANYSNLVNNTIRNVDDNVPSRNPWGPTPYIQRTREVATINLKTEFVKLWKKVVRFRDDLKKYLFLLKKLNFKDPRNFYWLIYTVKQAEVISYEVFKKDFLFEINKMVNKYKGLNTYSDTSKFLQQAIGYIVKSSVSFTTSYKKIKREGLAKFKYLVNLDTTNNVYLGKTNKIYYQEAVTRYIKDVYIEDFWLPHEEIGKKPYVEYKLIDYSEYYKTNFTNRMNIVAKGFHNPNMLFLEYYKIKRDWESTIKNEFGRFRSEINNDLMEIAFGQVSIFKEIIEQNKDYKTVLRLAKEFFIKINKDIINSLESFKTSMVKYVYTTSRLNNTILIFQNRCNLINEIFNVEIIDLTLEYQEYKTLIFNLEENINNIDLFFELFKRAVSYFKQLSHSVFKTDQKIIIEILKHNDVLMIVNYTDTNALKTKKVQTNKSYKKIQTRFNTKFIEMQKFLKKKLEENFNKFKIIHKQWYEQKTEYSNIIIEFKADIKGLPDDIKRLNIIVTEDQYGIDFLVEFWYSLNLKKDFIKNYEVSSNLFKNTAEKNKFKEEFKPNLDEIIEINKKMYIGYGSKYNILSLYFENKRTKVRAEGIIKTWKKSNIKKLPNKFSNFGYLKKIFSIPDEDLLIIHKYTEFITKKYRSNLKFIDLYNYVHIDIIRSFLPDDIINHLLTEFVKWYEVGNELFKRNMIQLERKYITVLSKDRKINIFGRLVPFFNVEVTRIYTEAQYNIEDKFITPFYNKWKGKINIVNFRNVDEERFNLIANIKGFIRIQYLQEKFNSIKFAYYTIGMDPRLQNFYTDTFMKLTSFMVNQRKLSEINEAIQKFYQQSTNSQLSTAPVLSLLGNEKEYGFKLIGDFKLPTYLKCPQLEELQIFTYGQEPNFFFEYILSFFGLLFAFMTKKPMVTASLYQDLRSGEKLGIFKYSIPPDLVPKKPLGLKFNKENIFNKSQRVILKRAFAALMHNASRYRSFNKKFYKQQLPNFDVLNDKVLKNSTNFLKRFGKKFLSTDFSQWEKEFTESLEGIDKATTEEKFLKEIYASITQIWEVFKEIFAKISINDRQRYFTFMSLIFDVPRKAAMEPIKNSNTIAYIIAMRNIKHKAFWLTNPGLLTKMNQFQEHHLAKYNYDTVLQNKPNFMIWASFLMANKDLGFLTTQDILTKDNQFIVAFNTYKNFLIDAKLLDPTHRTYPIEKARRNAREFFYPPQIIPRGRGFQLKNYRGLLSTDLDSFRAEQGYLKHMLE